MKSIALKAGSLSEVARLYESREKGRIVSFKVLRTLKGVPLYRQEGDKRGGEIKVRRGETLIGEVGFLAPPGTDPLAVLTPALRAEEVDVGYARFAVEPLEVEAVRLGDLGADAPERIEVEILTPLLISVKILATPGVRGRLRGVKAYRLLPSPAHLVAQAARQLALTGGCGNPAAISRAARRVAAALDPQVAEVDFQLRPVTAIYSKERRVRGVVGRLVLEPLTEEARVQVWAMLRAASFTGLGKSRGVGFGDIRVVPGRPGRIRV
jgi:hypothetical protein